MWSPCIIQLRFYLFTVHRTACCTQSVGTVQPQAHPSMLQHLSSTTPTYSYQGYQFLRRTFMLRPCLLIIPTTAMKKLQNLYNQSYGVHIMPHHATINSLHTDRHIHMLLMTRSILGTRHTLGLVSTHLVWKGQLNCLCLIGIHTQLAMLWSCTVYLSYTFIKPQFLMSCFPTPASNYFITCMHISLLAMCVAKLLASIH